MIILTNGLTDVSDEGFLNVANSLVKRIKKAVGQDAFVITYERKSSASDKHLSLNKLLLNKELFSILRKRREKLLYIPFPAKAIATALRIFILSVFSTGKPAVILVQKSPINFLGRILLKLSGAKIIVFSKDSANYYSEIIGTTHIEYIKTGVDTERFCPVSQDEQKNLKIKYGFSPDRPLVLHVGHLKAGRNVEQLLKIDKEKQVLLVVSTMFLNDQDRELRRRLEGAEGIRIMDDYLPQIQEIYQMADAYFFPVVESGNCIDVPLSCLEAAACGKPIVTTPYGEMKEFEGQNGFYFIDSFDVENINALVSDAVLDVSSDVRSAVLSYDWQGAISALL